MLRAAHPPGQELAQRDDPAGQTEFGCVCNQLNDRRVQRRLAAGDVETLKPAGTQVREKLPKPGGVTERRAPHAAELVFVPTKKGIVAKLAGVRTFQTDIEHCGPAGFARRMIMEGHACAPLLSTGVLS
jgi:hypothetical protein